MTTKLTLSVDVELIKKAKIYAKNTGRSLSDIVEEKLSELVDAPITEIDIQPKLKKLIGIVKLPKNFDEKKALRSYFTNKNL